MDVSTLGNSSFGVTQASVDGAQIAQTFDQFLLLLTTQLQNQDPLSPMDSTEFTAQLVQFANVEQGIKSNEHLEQLIQLQEIGQAAGAVDYLGHTVEVISSQGALADGEAEFNYTLDANAVSGVITIRDESGLLINTLPADVGAGTHNFVWNGEDANGVEQPDGVYTMEVLALDEQENTVPVTITHIGKVTGVTSENGVLLLEISGLKVPLADTISLSLTQEDT